MSPATVRFTGSRMLGQCKGFLSPPLPLCPPNHAIQWLAWPSFQGTWLGTEYYHATVGRGGPGTYRNWLCKISGLRCSQQEEPNVLRIWAPPDEFLPAFSPHPLNPAMTVL